jgi:hypothetical protein
MKSLNLLPHPQGCERAKEVIGGPENIAARAIVGIPLQPQIIDNFVWIERQANCVVISHSIVEGIVPRGFDMRVEISSARSTITRDILTEAEVAADGRQLLSQGKIQEDIRATEVVKDTL